MKGGVLALTTAVALGWGSAALWAHHAFSRTYVPEQRITIEGDVVELIHRNPHSYVHVVAPDRQDQVRRWALEWAGRDDGRGHGGPMQTLKVGDHVILTGSPGRDPGTFRILVRTIVRPSDGWQWNGTAR